MRMSIGPVFALLGLSAILGIGCGEDPDRGGEPERRAVRTIPLAKSSPERSLERVGVAGPYQEERIGFDVSGRIEFVVDEGMEVEGAVTDEEGAVVRAGDPIAKIDDTRYRQALDTERATLERAKRRLDAQRLEIETQAPADIEMARLQVSTAEEDLRAADAGLAGLSAQRDEAKAQFDRAERLLAQGGGSISQADYDKAKASSTSADASVTRAQAERASLEIRMLSHREAFAKAQGALAVKRAELLATEAEIGQIETSIRRAERDVADCLLVAPFNGKVTKIFARRGGHTSAGQPVLTLTLLDPMEVSFAVSAQDDRRIHVGDRAFVRSRGGSFKVDGWIRDRSQVADPATRTFQINVTVRNLQSTVEPVDAPAEIPAVKDFFPVVERSVARPDGLFVYTGCVGREGETTYVLRVPEFTAWGGGASGIVSAAFKPEKIGIELGDEYSMFLHWVFRKLVNQGALESGDLLLVDPKPEHAAGVVLRREEWAIRPGELVDVSIPLGTYPEGFYVPNHAILWRDGATWVFLADPASGVARRIEVKVVGEPVGETRRIEGEGLAEGGPLVVEGVVYLADGDPIQVAGGPSR